MCVCVWGGGDVVLLAQNIICEKIADELFHKEKHINCGSDSAQRIHVVVVDRFYIALFTAVEQTRCALVACDSESVTIAFYSAF